MKTAIIAGATGLIGSHLVRLLNDDQDFESVIALVRNKGAISSKINSSKLKELPVDYDRLSAHAEAMKATHWYCTLGTTIKKAGSKEAFAKVDRDYVLEFARIAKQNGCESFNVVTAVESNPKSPLFYGKIKGEVEELLKSMQLKSLNIYRPSLLEGERNEFRLAEQLAVKASRVLAGLVPKPLRMISASKVANAMIIISKKQDIPETVRVVSSAEMQDM